MFAAKTAGGADGAQVSVLDTDTAEKLRAVFWDMTIVAALLPLPPGFEPIGAACTAGELWDHSGIKQFLRRLTIMKERNIMAVFRVERTSNYTVMSNFSVCVEPVARKSVVGFSGNGWAGDGPSGGSS